jgi:hypothetical protein
VRWPEPQWIGIGASLGFLIAFLLLISMMRLNRRRWLDEEPGKIEPALETA